MVRGCMLQSLWTTLTTTKGLADCRGDWAWGDYGQLSVGLGAAGAWAALCLSCRSCITIINCIQRQVLHNIPPKKRKKTMWITAFASEKSVQFHLLCRFLHFHLFCWWILDWACQVLKKVPRQRYQLRLLVCGTQDPTSRGDLADPWQLPCTPQNCKFKSELRMIIDDEWSPFLWTLTSWFIVVVRLHDSSPAISQEIPKRTTHWSYQSRHLLGQVPNKCWLQVV